MHNIGGIAVTAGIFLYAAALFALMAGACHSTVGTIAAAGGFALFLIPHKAHYNSGDNSDKHKAYNYGSNICF